MANGKLTLAKGSDGQGLYFEDELIREEFRIDFEDSMNELVKRGLVIKSFESKVIYEGDGCEFDTSGPFPKSLKELIFST